MAKARPVRRVHKPELCPCHSGAHYDACCRPWHEGQNPPTAVGLMRSRYSAYALGNIRHIIATTHPTSPRWQEDKAAWRRDLRQFCQETTFAALKILGSTETGTQATVTFWAGLLAGEEDISYTEQSLFEQVDGRWLYIAPAPAFPKHSV